MWLRHWQDEQTDNLRCFVLPTAKLFAFLRNRCGSQVWKRTAWAAKSHYRSCTGTVQGKVCAMIQVTGQGWLVYLGYTCKLSIRCSVYEPGEPPCVPMDVLNFHLTSICEFKLELRSGNGWMGSWPLRPWPLRSDLDLLHEHRVCRWQ